MCVRIDCSHTGECIPLCGPTHAACPGDADHTTPCRFEMTPIATADAECTRQARHVDLLGERARERTRLARRPSYQPATRRLPPGALPRGSTRRTPPSRPLPPDALGQHHGPQLGLLERLRGRPRVPRALSTALRQSGYSNSSTRSSSCPALRATGGAVEAVPRALGPLPVLQPPSPPLPQPLRPCPVRRCTPPQLPSTRGLRCQA